MRSGRGLRGVLSVPIGARSPPSACCRRDERQTESRNSPWYTAGLHVAVSAARERSLAQRSRHAETLGIPIGTRVACMIQP